VTADDAEIAWRVHLANRKAAWYQFLNAMDLGAYALEAPRRNAMFRGADRARLVIDPGQRSVSGREVSGPAHRFDSGTFFGSPVYLGELRTDEAGRLVVLGGLGRSAALDLRMRPTTFANNDLWHDDTSDGPVRATIRATGRVFEAEAAMIAVAPPNIGQGLYGVVTMYDLLCDLFRHSFGTPEPARPEFWLHVYPVLERLCRLQWVNEGFHFLFGPGSPSDWTEPGLLARLADPGPDSAPLRRRVFSRFRVPGRAAPEPVKLPPFYGDGYNEVLDADPDNAGSAWMSVTPTQYERLRLWADGQFDVGAPEVSTPLDCLGVAEQPAALDRAAMEDCLGGPFHPGIELTWTLRLPRMWAAPFRLRILGDGVQPQDDYGDVLQPAVAVGPGGVLGPSGPGTLTRWLGVPWQTDEASCLAGYQPGTYLPAPSFWAARVPNHVLDVRGYRRVMDTSLPLAQRLKHLGHRQEWLRFFGPSYLQRINDNVLHWDKAGVVAEHPGPDDHAQHGLPERLWVETGADLNFRGPDDTFAQLLEAEGAAPPAFAAPPAGPVLGRRHLGRDEL
jgi:hypothetical protein